MANITTTAIDEPGLIELHRGEFRDELLNFAAAATIKKGTILARIAASGKLTPFVIGGSGGAELPLALLTYEVVSAGAGDVSIRALIAGVVNKNRLIVHADGNGTNITNAILDQLRNYAIDPVDVAQV